MLISMLIDMRSSLPLLLSGVVWGIAIEAYRRSTGGGRRHYIAAATSVVVFGVLPLSGLVPSGEDGVSALIALVGLIYIVGGILDHRALVRALGRVSD
jgi:hypothetical protein